MLFKLLLRRIGRFVPAYFAVFISGWTLVYRMGSGPHWQAFDEIFYNCNTYWWANILLINNLVPGDTFYLEGCMVWGSYICTEIQLFLLFMVILYLYHRVKFIAKILIALAFFSGVAATFFILYNEKILPGYLFPYDTRVVQAYGVKPSPRLDSFALAIVMGLFYYKLLKKRRH